MTRRETSTTDQVTVTAPNVWKVKCRSLEWRQRCLGYTTAKCLIYTPQYICWLLVLPYDKIVVVTPMSERFLSIYTHGNTATNRTLLTHHAFIYLSVYFEECLSVPFELESHVCRFNTSIEHCESKRCLQKLFACMIQSFPLRHCLGVNKERDADM